MHNFAIVLSYFWLAQSAKSIKTSGSCILIYLKLINYFPFNKIKSLPSLNTTVILCGEHWKIGSFYCLCLRLLWLTFPWPRQPCRNIGYNTVQHMTPFLFSDQLAVFKSGSVELQRKICFFFDLFLFVLENLQVQEKFKQVAGGEYIGFSNATWVC